MDNNRGQTIFLSVIGIATLLVAIIGATFAYFTTTMSGDAANATATTAKIGAVSFTAEGITENNTKILPGWSSGTKEVTVSLGTSDYDVAYSCYLDITANDASSTLAGAEALSDMYLNVTGDNVVAAANNKALTAVEKIKIADGKIASGETKTMTYELVFKETGTNQDKQQDAKITGSVSCELAGGTVYYNNGNPTGTTTVPGAASGSGAVPAPTTPETGE